MRYKNKFWFWAVVSLLKNLEQGGLPVVNSKCLILPQRVYMIGNHSWLPTTFA